MPVIQYETLEVDGKTYRIRTQTDKPLDKEKVIQAIRNNQKLAEELKQEEA